MKKFSWGKAIGYGTLLWMIMFVIGIVVVAGLNIALDVAGMLVLAIVAALVTYTCSVAAAPQSPLQSFGYGATFTLIGLLLDLLVTKQFEPGIFTIWSYWMGYLLVMIVPLTALRNGQTNVEPHA